MAGVTTTYYVLVGWEGTPDLRTGKQRDLQTYNRDKAVKWYLEGKAVLVGMETQYRTFGPAYSSRKSERRYQRGG